MYANLVLSIQNRTSKLLVPFGTNWATLLTKLFPCSAVYFIQGIIIFYVIVIDLLLGKSS